MVKLFDEVAYVWPKVGYPPLVTPFSQYVKNLALFNVISLEKGKQRWEIFPDTVWDMVLGKTGRLPGPVDDEIKALAASQGREFTDADPQGNYPDCLDDYRKQMDEKGWAYGEDDEELFEFAMHPQQYESFRNGKAKADFEADLAKRKAAQDAPAALPSVITVRLNGVDYKLDVAYGDAAPAASAAPSPTAAPQGAGEELTAPLSGKFFLTKDTQETPKKVGDAFKKGETLCYIEAMKVQNAVAADFDGVVTAILKSNGESVDEDEVILKVSRT